MSCWVVPTVAAEYLNMSLDSLMQKVNEGSIPSVLDHGFLMIDVAPNSPRLGARSEQTYAERKPLHDERVTLNIESLADNTKPGEIQMDIEEPVAEPMELMGDWKTARKSVGRQRRRPTALAA